MKYSLDTNTCIRIINGRSPEVRAKLITVNPDDIIVCSVVRSELWYGAQKSQTPVRNRQKQDLFLKQFKSLPFDTYAAEQYAVIRADLERKGTPIGAMDMLIGAIAKAYDLILITHNLREFQRIPNLKLENWQQN
ncbi:MAG: type II toxin-antitoxin system VapC family toxin [Chloroflexota bacterium]